jgi:hypothetical protein
MKMQLKLMLLLFGVLFIFFMGCKKHDHGRSVTIASTNLVSPKPGNITGTFIATGAFNTSGTQVMDVVPLGTDSIHCILNCTAQEGTFTIEMKCEKPPMMNGAWRVIGGTGAYAFLSGSGSLIMSFPPDPLVPPGALSVETMTGVVWLHP